MTRSARRRILRKTRKLNGLILHRRFARTFFARARSLPGACLRESLKMPPSALDEKEDDQDVPDGAVDDEDPPEDGAKQPPAKNNSVATGAIN